MNHSYEYLRQWCARTLTLLVSCFLISHIVFSQTYTHPTVGVQNTFVGACPVATCSGTSYDNGGAAANYSPNINNIRRTFFPSTPGMCVRATFTSFAMNDTYFLCFGPNSCCDYLTIYNGPTTASAVLYNNCTTFPGTITSSNPSGALTLAFTSDASVQLGGWAATLSCVPCIGSQTSTSSSDCINHMPLVGNGFYSHSATGAGIIAEGCSGCTVQELYSRWYRLKISSSGTLAFTIDPLNNSHDFDFALFGPNTGCSSLGTSIRCSAAAIAGNGNTGIGNGAADASEDISGDQWVSQLNVTAGDSYYLLVNTNTSVSSAYQFTFTGTAGIASTLPVHLFHFSGSKQNGYNQLVWKAAEDANTATYEVQRSNDGQVYAAIASINANGNQVNDYSFNDNNPAQTKTFYRLRIIERDGSSTYSEVIWIDQSRNQGIVVYPNPANDIINIHTGSTALVNTSAQLIDANGKTVQRISLTALQAQVNIAQLSPGLYLLKFADGTVKSFIKAKN